MPLVCVDSIHFTFPKANHQRHSRTGIMVQGLSVVRCVESRKPVAQTYAQSFRTNAKADTCILKSTWRLILEDDVQSVDDTGDVTYCAVSKLNVASGARHGCSFW
jgi:hypothetical protein